MVVEEPSLLQPYDFKGDQQVSGLKKFCAEACLYTINKYFYIPAPDFSASEENNIWEIGVLDVRENMFFETGVMVLEGIEQSMYIENIMKLLNPLMEKGRYRILFDIFGNNLKRFRRRNYVGR